MIDEGVLDLIDQELVDFTLAQIVIGDALIDDLVSISCDILTIGQYLQPTVNHLKVERWVTPDEFAEWKRRGEARGLWHVESGPMVRSSYHAEKQVTGLHA